MKSTDSRGNSRRQFITVSATSILAGSLLPHYVAASTWGPSGNSLPVTGHGNHTYKVDKAWGVQDPARVPVNDCHEMVQDSKGRIFMTTTGKGHPNLIVYDRSGKVLESVATELPGAHGLTIGGEGTDEFLLITDPVLHKVVKTTLKGKVLATFQWPEFIPEYTDEKDFNPTETAIAPNGDIYIADGYGKNMIIQYDQHGNYLRHFGGTGNGDNQFDCCHGITIDHRDSNAATLLITSRASQEFKRFTLDGQFIETIKLPGCSICRPVIKGDHLYFAVIITESWFAYDGMLAVLDKNNKVVSFPGGSAPTYRDGQLEKPAHDGTTFLNPHDVLVDEDENLYVPQWYSGKTYPVKLHRQ